MRRRLHHDGAGDSPPNTSSLQEECCEIMVELPLPSKEDSSQNRAEGWFSMCRICMAVALTIHVSFVFACGFLVDDVSSPRLRKNILYFDDARKMSPLASRPRAVFHIGPHKTATSSIQDVLRRDVAKKYLQEDGYFYMHRSVHDNPLPYELLHSHDRDDDEPYDESVWEPFAAFMQSLRQKGINYLASDEAFAHFIDSPELLKPIKEALDGFDVRVVAAYRRYPEWIWSFYMERYKRKTHETIPTFAEFFASQLEKESKVSQTFYPLHLTLWMNLTEDFCVFNYHDHRRDSLVSDFICETITGADRTCKAARKGRLEIDESSQEEVLLTEDPTNKTPSKNWFEARRFALVALERDWITIVDNDDLDDDYDWWEYRSRQFDPFIQKITDFMDSQQNDLPLPLICPSEDQLDVIYRRALELERVLVPEFHENEGKLKLEESFSKAKSEGQYCNIDTEKALESEVWREFLKTLMF